MDFKKTDAKTEAVKPAVRQEVATPNVSASEVAPANTQYYLQLAAFKEKSAAQSYAQKVKVYNALINERMIIESAALHRVKVGPLTKQKAQDLKNTLKSDYQIRAFLLFE